MESFQDGFTTSMVENRETSGISVQLVVGAARFDSKIITQ